MYYLCYSQGVIFKNVPPGKFSVGHLRVLFSSAFLSGLGYDIPPRIQLVDPQPKEQSKAMIDASALITKQQQQSQIAALPPASPISSQPLASSTPANQSAASSGATQSSSSSSTSTTTPAASTSTATATPTPPPAAMVDSMSMGGLVSADPKVSIAVDKDLEDFFHLDYIPPLPDDVRQQTCPLLSAHFFYVSMLTFTLSHDTVG
jgi:Flp pilus assembly protein TadG